MSDRQASESRQREGARTADDALTGTIDERRIARMSDRETCRIGKSRIAGNCRIASGKPTARRSANGRRRAERQRGRASDSYGEQANSGGKTFWGYIRGRSNWLGGRSNEVERGSNVEDNRRVLRTLIESHRDELRTRYLCLLLYRM